MFRFFRTHSETVKKYVLVGALGIMSVSMVFMFTPIGGSDSSRMDTSTVAEVDGSSITTQELTRAIQSRMRNMQAGPDSSRMIPLFAKPVLDEMILQRALVAQAGKLGLYVSDEELRQALQAIPTLYSNGSFLPQEQYEAVVQQITGMTVTQFEEQMRQNILLEKIQDVIVDSVQVTPAEVHTEFLKRNSKVKIEYVAFDPSQFVKAVPVTDQALQAFFQQSQDRYKVPEQRRARYLLLERERLRGQAKPSEDEMRQYYTQHISDYRVPDRVRVAHILFKTTGKKPDEIATLEKTAGDALNQLKSGADFGELAKKYSEDSTASNGGDLGWVVHGQTVKEFETAAFSMQPGQTSGLIKTTYGMHILKVLDKQTAHLQTFDEVKESIRSTLEKQKMASAEQTQVDELGRKLKANPQAFDTIAKQEGLEAKDTPLFKYQQAVPDLGNSETFRNLAFQLSVNSVGGPFTVPKGQAIIQVAEIVPEHNPKLEEIRARVEEDYRAGQSNVLATQKAREFAAQSRNGDFAKLAKADKLEVKESKEFTRRDEVEGLGSGLQFEAAFSLAPGQASDVVSLGQKSVVFRVVSQSPANEAELAAQKDPIREELLEEKRNLAFEIYRQSLKKQLIQSKELRVNEVAMKQFLASYTRQ